MNSKIKAKVALNKTLVDPIGRLPVSKLPAEY